MDETHSLYLKASHKIVYMGHRRWLNKNDEWRNREDFFDNTKEKRGKPRKRSGIEILQMLNNWEECPEPGKKRKRVEPLLKVWKTRCPFWDLKY